MRMTNRFMACHIPCASVCRPWDWWCSSVRDPKPISLRSNRGNRVSQELHKRPTAERASGVLLHLTSLPSRYGIGDMGPMAYAFVDELAEANQRLWQVLPLVPIDLAHYCSPYSSSSAYAGNKYLISPEHLVNDTYLEPEDIAEIPTFPTQHIEYTRVLPYKDRLLDIAYERFLERDDRDGFSDFCRAEASWLDTYAIFEVAKEIYDGRSWHE
ncbi:hypothetical protein GF377_07915, partial [candidate division GN15 bacterium]|nr:hypothetical protein [candidate division GN15 bacterium]